MDNGKTLEERFLGRFNVVFGCAVLILCIYYTCRICVVVNTWCCVHVVYAMLCTYCICGVVGT